jgi:hypothetical protein
VTDRPVIRLTPDDRTTAASRIFATHSAEEVAEIITWADRDIAERLRALVARFTTKDRDAA